METQYFSPRSSTLIARRAFGAFFAVGGAVFACVFVVAGTAFVLLFWASAEFSLPVKLLSLLFPLVGGGMGVVFVLAGLGVALWGMDQAVQVTSEALQHRQGKTTVSMRFDQMTRVYALRQAGQRHGHWVMVVEDAAGDQIQLDIASGGVLAMFDTLSIARALLPRLPPGVDVDERMREYVDSGRISR